MKKGIFYNKLCFIANRLIFHRQRGDRPSCAYSAGRKDIKKKKVEKKADKRVERLKKQYFDQRYRLLAKKKLATKSRKVERDIKVRNDDPDRDPGDLPYFEDRTKLTETTSYSRLSWRKQSLALYRYLENRILGNPGGEITSRYRLTGPGYVQGRHDLNFKAKLDRNKGITVYWRTKLTRGKFYITSHAPYRVGKIPRYFRMHERAVTNNAYTIPGIVNPPSRRTTTRMEIDFVGTKV